MKRIIALFSVLFFFSHCTLDNGNPYDVEYTNYDLLYSYEGVNMRYVKLNVFDFLSRNRFGGRVWHLGQSNQEVE